MLRGHTWSDCRITIVGKLHRQTNYQNTVIVASSATLIMRTALRGLQTLANGYVLIIERKQSDATSNREMEASFEIPSSKTV